MSEVHSGAAVHWCSSTLREDAYLWISQQRIFIAVVKTVEGAVFMYVFGQLSSLKGVVVDRRLTKWGCYMLTLAWTSLPLLVLPGQCTAVWWLPPGHQSDGSCLARYDRHISHGRMVAWAIRTNYSDQTDNRSTLHPHHT